MSTEPRRPLRLLLGMLPLPALLLLPALASAGGGAETGTDPWMGKHRAELVAWLGEPDRSKRKDGGELLTYRVVRLAADAAPSADLRLIELPEIGRVGRKLSGPAPAVDTVTVEPTEVNRRGTASSGGVTTTRSVSRTLGDDAAGEETSTDESGVPAGTKLKLRFVLDANGRVSAWSVDGAKKR